MRILFIANARRKGGLSGGDNIYLNLIKHCDHSIRVWSMMDIDFEPFWLCYLYRILLGCFIALIEPQRYDLVYSASDFLMDSLPAFIMKIKGNKWIAGFFLFAPKNSKIYYCTQKFAKKIIDKYADMVIVTNPTMFPGFPNKKKTWINGGIDLSLAEGPEIPKKYDAVFCGRIHKTKGIDRMLAFWSEYKKTIPCGRLAIIGDGDLGMEYIRSRVWTNQMDIDLYGYMGDERFEIYKQSEVVLYPTPLEYDHFSMAPVEAMACGCTLVCDDLPTVKAMGAPHINFKTWLGGNHYLNFWGPVLWAQKFSWEDQTKRVWEDIQCVF